jgi:Tfp pilus assembly protein PilF
MFILGIRRMKWTVAVVVAALLVGACASKPPIERPLDLFADDLFAPKPAAVGSATLFDLNEPMLAFLAAHVGYRSPGALPTAPERLFIALRQNLRLDYEAGETRTAAETFASRSGNCLSLAIMAGAFAKYLGMPTQYQIVRGLETWSRQGGIAFRNAHVNMVLGAARSDALTVKGSMLEVDFSPPGATHRRLAVPIAEETVVAMYLNNRAAEALAAGDVRTAYWWAREATAAAPGFLGGYNTLAVVYRRHGSVQAAERVLRFALERNGSDTDLLSNLALVLEQQGRDAEAAAVRARLAQLLPVRPFYYEDQGLAALARGDDEAARDFFKRELERMPYDDHLNFLIGVTELRLGNTRAARRYVEAAVKAATTRQRRSVYASKLEYLGSLPRE